MITQSERAAIKIVEKYKKYLLAEHMGNQDEDALIRTISQIIIVAAYHPIFRKRLTLEMELTSLKK